MIEVGAGGMVGAGGLVGADGLVGAGSGVGKPVLLIRAAGNERDAAELAKLGIDSVIDPYLEIRPSASATAGQRLLEWLEEGPGAGAGVEGGATYLVITSANTLPHWASLVGEQRLRDAILGRPRLRFAAVGPSTARSIREFLVNASVGYGVGYGVGSGEGLGGGSGESYGGGSAIPVPAVFLPSAADSLTLARELIAFAAGGVNAAGGAGGSLATRPTALLPGGEQALPDLPAKLSDAGWSVQTAAVYATTPVAQTPATAAAVAAGHFAAVVMRSPSAANAFTKFVPNPPAQLPLIAAGPTTAAAIAAQGRAVAQLPLNSSSAAVAAAVANSIAKASTQNAN